MTHSSPTKITVPETIGPASGAARQQARPLSAKTEVHTGHKWELQDLKRCK